MNVLVTGCAGFIGMHVATALLARGDQVVGVDNLNDYYDVSLKEARLARLTSQPGFRFVRSDVADGAASAALFAAERFDARLGTYFTACAEKFCARREQRHNQMMQQTTFVKTALSQAAELAVAMVMFYQPPVVVAAAPATNVSAA